MEGDKVTLTTIAEEISGEALYSTKISEKPQFMLQQEYNEQVIGCAVESLKIAVKTVYPNNEATQRLLAKSIAEKVNNE